MASDTGHQTQTSSRTGHNLTRCYLPLHIMAMSNFARPNKGIIKSKYRQRYAKRRITNTCMASVLLVHLCALISDDFVRLGNLKTATNLGILRLVKRNIWVRALITYRTWEERSSTLCRKSDKEC